MMMVRCDMGRGRSINKVIDYKVKKLDELVLP